jgi:hypothetical protein
MLFPELSVSEHKEELLALKMFNWKSVFYGFQISYFAQN